MPTAENIIDGNLRVRGTLRPDGLAVPEDSVGDAGWNPSSPLTVGNQKHLHARGWSQTGTATSVTQPIHYARGAGSVTGFRAGSVAIAVGAATLTVDLRKNGSTVLSAVITLDSGNAAYTAEAGTINSAAYVAGDVFTVVTVATAGGGTVQTGPYAEADFDEAAP